VKGWSYEPKDPRAPTNVHAIGRGWISYAPGFSPGDAQVPAACAPATSVAPPGSAASHASWNVATPPNPSSSGSSVHVVKAKVVQPAPFDSAGPTVPMGTVVQATAVSDVPFKDAPPAYGQQGGVVQVEPVAYTSNV
jgi:hypothetical protein